MSCGEVLEMEEALDRVRAGRMIQNVKPAGAF